MLDRIRGYSDFLTDAIAAKPTLYMRMRSVVRSRILYSDSCRFAILKTTDKPDKANALLIYNRLYDLANLGNMTAVDMLQDVAIETGIGITLGDQHFGPPKIEPKARKAEQYHGMGAAA